MTTRNSAVAFATLNNDVQRIAWSCISISPLFRLNTMYGIEYLLCTVITSHFPAGVVVPIGRRNAAHSQRTSPKLCERLQIWQQRRA